MTFCEWLLSKWMMKRGREVLVGEEGVGGEEEENERRRRRRKRVMVRKRDVRGEKGERREGSGQKRR